MQQEHEVRRYAGDHAELEAPGQADEQRHHQGDQVDLCAEGAFYYIILRPITVLIDKEVDNGFLEYWRLVKRKVKQV